MWTEKYRPENFNDFIGSKDIVRVLKVWIEKWMIGKTIFPILILWGRSGIGKTTIAHCLANEFGYELSEYNASDERNVKDIKKVILVTGSRGLLQERRLTVLDEADYLSKASQKILISKISGH